MARDVERRLEVGDHRLLPAPRLLPFRPAPLGDPPSRGREVVEREPEGREARVEGERERGGADERAPVGLREAARVVAVPEAEREATGHAAASVPPRIRRALRRVLGRSLILRAPAGARMLDVPPETVARFDRAGMLREVLRLPDQIEAALRGSIPRIPTPSRVLVAGMGGSAIAGSYLAAWADHDSRIPISVSRSYELPSWVDASTLVLAVSFSGETEETLHALVQAKERGAKIAAVGTGGRIEKFARAAGGVFAPVPAAPQPRAQIGSMLATEALVLEAAGVLEARPALGDAVRTLRAMAPDLAGDVPPPRNEGKRIALAIAGTIPCAYGGDALAPTATRFANQVQENSKTLAWSATMPEMNHNELVAWDATEDVDGVAAVFFRDRLESRAMTERWDFAAEVVRKRGAPLVQLEAKGESIVARQLSVTMVGDAASVYLAALRGVDPSPVDLIGALKKRVGTAGVVAELDRKMRL